MSTKNDKHDDDNDDNYSQNHQTVMYISSSNAATHTKRMHQCVTTGVVLGRQSPSSE